MKIEKYCNRLGQVFSTPFRNFFNIIILLVSDMIIYILLIKDAGVIYLAFIHITKFRTNILQITNTTKGKNSHP